jgi:FAD/FMN-containing dehydrogenase
VEARRIDQPLDALAHGEPSARAALRDAVGAAQVLTEGELSAYEVDWRRRYRGRAAAVVRPGSAAEVAAVVRTCAAHRASIVVQGGNTGLVGGGVPDASGRQVLLSTRRLDRIRTIDVDNQSLVAEAGCVLQTVQDAARAQGLLFALSLAAEGSCTIGGNLATNAGGTQVLRYGNARELTLGLEVVTAEGEIWDGLSGLRKDNTGYDLRDLYIGSEGTLGIITAATLKLHPLPGSGATALVGCADPGQALRFLRLARGRLDAALVGCELMSRFSIELARRHFPALPDPLPAAPWALLVECTDAGDDAPRLRERFEAMLAAAIEQPAATDAVVATSLAQARELWRLRESIPLAQAAEGLNIKHDIALPLSAIPGFIAEADAELQARFPGVRIVDFGHLGDGNLHYNVQAPAGGDAAAFLAGHERAINGLVYDAVARRAGSFSAEHGIGALKRADLEARKSPVALALMRRLKAALDPQGRLNPGRVV